MFDNVLVGVDERHGSSDAIALARNLVAQGGQLTFGYVYPGEAHVWRGSSPPLAASEEQCARELLGAAARNADVDARLRWLGAPSVGRGLHELAETIRADLLVVGSSERGLLGRVLLGDDTRAALNGAPCAVAIAPAGYAHEPAVRREIGVGYDESPESEHAVRVARALAAAWNAKLSAMQAVSMPAYILGVGPLLIDDMLASLTDDARKQVSKLEGVEPHAVYGEAAEELALFSASLDLLVVGSRSYGPLGRLVHGSTSQQLARRARCPLLILTRAAREAERGNGSAAHHAVGAASVR